MYNVLLHSPYNFVPSMYDVSYTLGQKRKRGRPRKIKSAPIEKIAAKRGRPKKVIPPATISIPATVPSGFLPASVLAKKAGISIGPMCARLKKMIQLGRITPVLIDGRRYYDATIVLEKVDGWKPLVEYGLSQGFSYSKSTSIARRLASRGETTIRNIGGILHVPETFTLTKLKFVDA